MKKSAVVNNVLYPFSLEVVIEKLKTGLPLSVSIDASNKENHKFFPIGVQCFTPQDGITFSILDFYEDSFEDSRAVTLSSHERSESVMAERFRIWRRQRISELQSQ